jgi:hypothetical protein
VIAEQAAFAIVPSRQGRKSPVVEPGPLIAVGRRLQPRSREASLRRIGVAGAISLAMPSPSRLRTRLANRILSSAGSEVEPQPGAAAETNLACRTPKLLHQPGLADSRFGQLRHVH